MIYINNNTSTIIRTESWLSTIPEKIYIKFNDIEIGEFTNVSLIPTYIIFEISKETIDSLKLENMDYQMKLYISEKDIYNLKFYTYINEHVLTEAKGKYWNDGRDNLVITCPTSDKFYFSYCYNQNHKLYY